MEKGRITYCIVDGTDPSEEFECEGKVIKAFFDTSPVFDKKHSPAFIQPMGDIRTKLKRESGGYFNIFHLAAHGAYYGQTKHKLDYTVIYGRRGRQEVEIFAPETTVRLGLEADVFLSTCCGTFSPAFVEVIKNHDGHVGNFIAPIDDSWTGDTTVFSMMFYNQLLREIRPSQKKINDATVVRAFAKANAGYKSYSGLSTFKLYSWHDDKTYG